jgi:excisionase family DNA binding protein
MNQQQGHEKVRGKRYITVQDAVNLLNTSERTIRRMVKEERLHTIRDKTNHIWIDQDDVEQEREARPRSANPLLQQLQSCVERLEQRVLELEQHVEILREQGDVREQLFQALNRVQEAQEEAGAPTASVPWHQVAQMLTGLPRSRAAGGAPTMLAKRGLPPGTLRLADFARRHHIDIHELKQYHYEGKISLTVYHREVQAKRNKQEWWITAQQHQQVSAYWQQQGMPYTVCPQCAHQEVSDMQAG